MMQFEQKHSHLLSLVMGWALQMEMSSAVPTVCMIQSATPSAVSAVPASTVKSQGNVGTW